MKLFVYRNFTVEHLFSSRIVEFSGYDELTTINDNYDWVVWFYEIDPNLHGDRVEEEVEEHLRKIKFLFDNDNFTLNALILIPDLRFNRSIIETSNVFFIFTGFVDECRKIAERRNNLRLLFLSDFYNSVSISKLIDWKYYYSAKMIIPPSLAYDFNNWFETKFRSLLMNRKKCVVLDCDNTLWGGVIGEDGLEGILLGNSYPGQVYLDFQNYIKYLYNAGVIITLCSKNNEKDVWNVFENHPNMVLTKEMISDYEINWKNKVENLISISSKLNIGFDSMVFIDDSPFERESVKKELPEVLVPDFPKEMWNLCFELTDYLSSQFSLYNLTEEDKRKTLQYLERRDRLKVISSYSSMEDYLRSLEMKLTISEINDMNIERLSQMTQKTNQFNLTTKRYSTGDLRRLQVNGSKIYCLSVSDRFGDSGITGLIIINFYPDSLSKVYLDTFLLSCRILGRGIENAFFNTILNHLISNNVTDVFADYIYSAKNSQVIDFYEKFGFEILEEDNIAKKYYLQLNHNYLNKDYYYVKFN